MGKITAAITGIQGYVPDYILTNKELETLVDTNDEWITTRTVWGSYPFIIKYIHFQTKYFIRW